jgi:hypothetical protein
VFDLSRKEIWDELKSVRDAAEARAKDVWIGGTAHFLKTLDSNGVQVSEGGTPCTLMGLQVRQDARIPDGVWCMVPAGKTLLDEGVQVGSCGEEYEKSAQSFAAALAMMRT